ncbi:MULTISPECIES: HIRAN domain-containing protein [unclassified Candidatus Frackibacter]|uniref:HIRAN domain-containing protein n=1 Tax=unclassified Candidatus Frackibacter TaxID=2648818 RepID=UPI00087F42E5|nr:MULTISPECIES: HIRAN domain-containing protein [unclassified Candidatus Frackibacter]SDC84014.1 HIRAN domain-containing protein [Candidatus Frackibacter sp. WG11]SEM98490.1 HIRAN domain-containing protein [Candidatus Frackibacter sp. WG12]SFM05112.1 HIRAN domain-containing protein [Candidatus Frackibacter sp. WG13]
MVISKHKNELLVVWKDPVTRNRIVIGRLWREEGYYYFEYIRKDEDERGSIDFAMKMGYRPIKMFDDLDESYISKTLFAPFLNRLNGKKRQDKPFKELKRTGGKLNTDTLEFMTPIDETKEDRTVTFNIAGWRYYDGEKALNELQVDQVLHFEIEEDNMYDMHAIEIWTTNKEYKLGYVPAVYSRYIDKLVKDEDYKAVIKEINPDSNPHDILKVSFSGKMVRPKINRKEISIV